MATKELETVIRLKPDYIEAYLALGVLYEFKKEPEKAVSYYEEALKKNPLNKKVYYHLGSVYYKEKRFDEAVRQYELLLKIDPKELNGYVDLAFIYLGQERMKEAIEVLKRAETLGLKSERLFIAFGFANSNEKSTKRRHLIIRKPWSLTPITPRSIFI